MQSWTNRLEESGSLSREGYYALLMGGEEDALRESAQRVTQREFGCGVYVRALIEVTNRCRNNCYYCGIRAANRDVERYSLTKEQILEACGVAYDLGFRTFVMQGGEDPKMDDEWIVEVVSEVKRLYGDCAITLSLGERSYESYVELFEAGASRYLLRHETFDKSHYSMLHPDNMSYDNRMECLNMLCKIGYQVGTGMMVGSPYQTIDNLVDDLLFIERFKPQMVGIGPFIAHHATPFADVRAGDIDMTLRLISILRLINPRALIPSTTALATIAEDGRERGILAGANVVMPNVTPVKHRGDYSLYDNKAAFGSESAEGLQQLSDKLSYIDREINFARGDYKE